MTVVCKCLQDVVYLPGFPSLNSAQSLGTVLAEEAFRISDCHILISSLVCIELKLMLSLSPASLGDEEGPICLSFHEPV